MLLLRSLAFNVVFYASLVVQMIFWAPFYFVAPRLTAWFVPKFWARTSLALQDAITGSRHEITGLENLPAGSFILAPKHQSFWDVLAFFPLIDDPLFILKRELQWIPFFGWYVLKMRMIPGRPRQPIEGAQGCGNRYQSGDGAQPAPIDRLS